MAAETLHDAARSAPFRGAVAACIAAVFLAAPAAAASHARAVSAPQKGQLVLTMHVRACPERVRVEVDGRVRARVKVGSRHAKDYKLVPVAGGHHRIRVIHAHRPHCGLAIDRVRIDTPRPRAAAPPARPSAPAPPAPPTLSPPEPGVDPFAGARLYTDPSTNAARAERTARTSGDTATADQLQVIASTPQAGWFGDWNGANPASAVRSYASRAWTAGAMPVLVAYNLPGRDCGSYSSGGAPSADAYRAWIDGFAGALTGPAAVIVEPDALAELQCFDGLGQQQVYDLLHYAVTTLSARPGVAVYLDAGHSAWQTAQTMADRLRAAGVAGARGFSLNVSNFRDTPSQLAYGDLIGALVGGKHFVLDTSRNGRGADGAWCNPDGRGLGHAPTADTGDPYADALLWIKPPGESDGMCNGGPPAGQWWQAYALGLVQRAAL